MTVLNPLQIRLASFQQERIKREKMRLNRGMNVIPWLGALFLLLSGSVFWDSLYTSGSGKVIEVSGDGMCYYKIFVTRYVPRNRIISDKIWAFGFFQ